ncbi:MAG: CDP-diacylglycerol--serine O-phosphatidyltransferase [Halobacteria archaeon]|nr:CDP-diacylglycerol--serine O-phosphatidyltransferase [Halobacteria archaeon]
MNKSTKEGQRRRGIYLLPNLFTTAALFAGFYAIVAAINSHFEAAAVAVFIAMLLDGIDGRVARLTNTQTDFGAEYDSLSDMVSFGLAPALVMYQWALSDLGKLGWLAAFIYTAGAALRLARFNTQVGIADKRYFQGLPSPSAAAILAGMVWSGEEVFELAGKNVEELAFALTVLAGLLMVSNIRYHSFKGINFKERVPFVTILLTVLVIVVVSSNPPVMLFGGFMIYAISGPVLTLIYRRRRRAERKAQHQQETNSGDDHLENS